MTKSVYARIAQIKQTKYDKIVMQVMQKNREIEGLKQQKSDLEQELEDIIEALPAKKKAVYDEYFSQDVNRNTFEKIGYKIMVLEHEISAHRLKIKSQEELIEKAAEELAELQEEKKVMLKTVEKYSILMEEESKEKKKIQELLEDNEMEEFAKPQKGP